MKRNNPYSKENKALVALVSTPIGNRDDITLRAINYLKECDIVACEDTRNTSLLLSYYGIKNKKYVSLYAQNEIKDAKKIAKQVKEENLKLAYCSDAGMPGISDPGAILVQACYEENVPVTILPGPSASLSALVISNIDSADFSFYGFLPTKTNQLKTFLTELKDRKETLIFYESPKRIIKTLTIMKEVFSKDRIVSLIRELTKIHEECINGTIEELLNTQIEEKGECVIIVKGNNEQKEIDENEIIKEFQKGIKEGKSISTLSKEISSKYNLSKNKVYEIGLKIKAM